MYIKNIEVQNFKGIEDKKFEFNSNFTALIGDNGTGKTSILDSINIAIGTILLKTNSKFSFRGTNSRPLLNNEIRKISFSKDNIELTNVCLKGVFYDGERNYHWERTQPVNSKNLSYKNASEITNYGLFILENLNEKVDLPLFVHHTTARLWSNIFEKNTKYQSIGSRLEGYYACLDSRNIKDKFFNWFKTYEDEVLKFDKDKSLYEAFTNAITSMVKDWNKIHYSWYWDDLMGQVDGKSWLPLSNLSDGYRRIIHLTADIAYRAIKLNPHLGINAVTQTKGIVLIDELDMHLHPKWQRTVVEDLKRTFPNMQFIVTTHSPFIVQSLKANELINLDNRKFSENPDSLTIEENALHMGVEDDNSEKFDRKEKFAIEYLNLLKDANTPNDKAFMRAKELLLEFSDDPAFIAKLKIEELIKFKP
ncbi:MAG: AAA family ATPase [Flavobacterium sp.]|nr:AAA family ATPase [Flavobacterium sp.]MBP7319299.1 AAA family ATPase [Flavobacterium sp.]